MKNQLLLILSMTMATMCFGQSWNWAWGNQIGTAGDEEKPRLAVDNSDNVFVATTYEGSLALGDGTYPSPNDSGRDIVVAKYNADGALIWSSVFAGGGGTTLQNAGDLVYDITTDESGNAYIVGNLGPNAIAIGQDVGNSDNRNFVAKINADGSLGWITLADEDFLNDKLTCVEVGLDGKVYAGGSSGGGLDYYGFGGVSASGVDSFIDAEIVLIEMSSDGEVQWAKKITSREVRRMAFDQMGHIIISSYSNSGGPGNAGHYLTKLNLDSQEEVWVRYAYSNTIGTGRSELGLHVKADGGIVQFMTVGSTTVLDYGDGINSPGGDANRMGLLWHIGADGVATSVHAMYDQLIDAYTYITFDSFVALDDENYYIVGELIGEIEMTDGGLLTAHPDFIGNPNGKDILVLKIGIDGSISEMATQTGTAPQIGLDIGLFSDGNVAVCGLFDTPSHPIFGIGTTNFGDGDLMAVGGEDVFVARVTTGTSPPTSLSEIDQDLALQVFPNPTSGTIRLNAKRDLGQVLIRQYDLAGSLVAEQQYNSNEEWNYEMHGEAGLYLLEIYPEGASPEMIRVMKK